jgi:hypothetical protein
MKERPLSWTVCVAMFAKTGKHCRSAELIYQGSVPRDLQAECDTALAQYLKPENAAKRAEYLPLGDDH